MRHAHKLGCRSIMLSCASGAVRDVEPGTVGLITDQVNLTGRNPWQVPRALPPRSSRCRSSPWRARIPATCPTLARDAAAEVGVELAEGHLRYLLGPTYETAAEIRMLASFEADYVGMSMVCETIMARALGMEVLGLTLVTNKAGRADNNHAEVLEAANAAAEATQNIALGWSVVWLSPHNFSAGPCWALAHGRVSTHTSQSSVRIWLRAAHGTASVAQLAEHRSRKAGVTGSSPVAGSIEISRSDALRI